MNKDRLSMYADLVKTSAKALDHAIIARLAGVTFDGCQEHLAFISPSTSIKLSRDRRNEYDSSAVRVLAQLGDTESSWVHVGFIPSKMSPLIARNLDQGVVLATTVHRLLGGMQREGSDEKLNFGLEIRITPPSIEG